MYKLSFWAIFDAIKTFRSTTCTGRLASISKRLIDGMHNLVKSKLHIDVEFLKILIHIYIITLYYDSS